MFFRRRNKKWRPKYKFQGHGYRFYRRHGSEMANFRSSGNLGRKNGLSFLIKKLPLPRIITFIFILIFIYVVYYFFFSAAFKITAVNISGRENISEYALRNIIEDQMNNSRFLIFDQNNLLAFNKSRAEKNIKKNYVLENLEINKEFPHTLTVKIKEKVSTVVWVSGSEEEKKYYYLDLDGVVVGEIPAAEVERLFSGEKPIASAEEKVVDVISLEERGESKDLTENNTPVLPMIYDLSDSMVNIKDQVLDPKTVSFVIDLAIKFPEVLKEKKVKYFATPERANSRVNVIMEEGWSAYFESGKDPDKQLNNLSLVLDQKIKDSTKITYIDLRFDERIYYK